MDPRLIKIKELLSGVYKEASDVDKQRLVLYLSGWLAKADVDPSSAIEFVKALHEETGGDDPLRKRIAAVVYSYKESGVWDIDGYTDIIERETGAKPSELVREIEEDRREMVIDAWRGLQELLWDILGDRMYPPPPQLFEIICRIQEILDMGSPYEADPICMVLRYNIDHGSRLYACTDPANYEVVRAVSKNGVWEKKEIVTIGAPTRIEIYENPVSSNVTSMYKFRWEISDYWVLEIGPAPFLDIIKNLKARGLVIRRVMVYDVLAAIIEGFVRSGRSKVKPIKDITLIQRVARKNRIM